MCLVKTTMLSSVIRKNIIRVDVRHLSAFVSNYTNDVSKNKHFCSEPNMLWFAPNVVNNSRRYFSSQSGHDLSKQSLQLYKVLALFPFKFTIKLLNILVRFHIRRSRLEPEFDTEEFMNAARYAITVVSNALAQEDYKSLDGLVTPGFINELQTKLKNLTPAERKNLAVKDEDIFFSYIGSATWINEEDIKEVEIDVMVEYIPDGKRRFEQYGAENKLEKMVKLISERIMCKYVFVRRYFNDKGEPWVITALNRLPPF